MGVERRRALSCVVVERRTGLPVIPSAARELAREWLELGRAGPSVPFAALRVPRDDGREALHRGVDPMNLSLRWLQDFLRRELDPADVMNRLAMLGAPVDAVERLREELAPFVVARVLEVGPHPDPKATKVRLTTVDDGSGEPLTVVCGAPNVTAGKSYPFARLGTRLPGPKGFTIEARPIRGVVSQGMLCSARELGLGDEHDGILELDTDAAPGTPLLQAVPLADTRLVVDVTPNRPDLLGHKGVAREIGRASCRERV